MTDGIPMEVDCRSVHARQTSGDEFLFLDCREQDEYDRVRIEGSVLLPMSQIAQRASELNDHRDSDIIIHCHHGGRSMQVAMWLRQQGFSKAQSMAGGIDAWAQQVDPTMARY